MAPFVPIGEYKDPIEVYEGDTLVHADGETWVIDKRMWISIPEGSQLLRTGSPAKPVGKAIPWRGRKLHMYESSLKKS